MRCLLMIVALLSILVILSPAMASFSKTITDEKGDVEGLTGKVNMPNIDIEKVTYYQYSNGRVVISLKVYGEIDPNSVYSLYMNTTDGNIRVMYDIVYTQNPYVLENQSEVSIIEMTKGDEYKEIDGDFDIINDDTLRITFDLDNKNEQLIDLEVLTMFMDYSGNDITSFGTDYASLHIELNQTQQDQNQSGENQQSQQNDQGEKEKSPGFEVFLLLSALIISISILIRKKKL